jgi:MFS family permease
MARLIGRLWNALRLFGALSRNRDLRNVELAFLAFNAVWYGAWIALLLYAYRATGPASVGVVAMVLLIPSALFAPIAASLGDRMPRERYLLLGYAAQTFATGAVAVAMLAGAPALLVYGLGCIQAPTFAMTRPAQGALLPGLAERPEELTAANGLTAVFEGAGILIGPLGAAWILLAGSPAAVYLASTVVLAISAGLTSTVRVHHRGAIAATDPADASPLHGFRVLSRERDPRLIVGLIFALETVIGALDILFVLMALELFHTGESGAGVLNASLGAGLMVGGAVTLALVGRARLGPGLTLGGLAFGVVFASIALFPSGVVGAVLVAGAAVGLSVADAFGRTLLQRTVSDDVLARVFGVLEGLAMVAYALGSILVPALYPVIGLKGTIVAFAALLPALGLLATPGLRRIDARIVVPERELALLSKVPMFAPLRNETLESLARRATWVSAPAGTVLIREGEPGDRYYVLGSGALEVTRAGEHVHTMRDPGNGVGEIALLLDVPRTATVTVLEGAELLVLERADFLTAVTGHPEVTRSVERIASDRMPTSPHGGG